jgi:hypothetical protein
MSRLVFGDIATYLANTGWQAQVRRWRCATVWSDADGHDLFLPNTDDLADRDIVIATILDVLADVECRSRAEIAWHVSQPFADLHSYVTFPYGLPHAGTTVACALDVAGCVRDLIDIAAVAVLGDPSGEVDRLLHRIRLRPAYTDGHGVLIGIPTDCALGAAVSEHVRKSITTVWECATEEGDVHTALRRLAGPDGSWPFTITFRSAGGSTTVLPFPAGGQDYVQLTGVLPLTKPIQTFSTTPYPPLEEAGWQTTG